MPLHPGPTLCCWDDGREWRAGQQDAALGEVRIGGGGTEQQQNKTAHRHAHKQTTDTATASLGEIWRDEGR